MSKQKKVVACRDIFRYICENLDQNLDSPECREIREHIDVCPDCVAYLDSLKKTVQLYRVYPDPVVPAKTRRQIYAVLNLPPPAKKTVRRTKAKK